jgi:uncharacterized membrane protein (DUF485 family)
MVNKIIQNFKEKSRKERFLFVIGMSIFLAYFVLGLIFIFWNEIAASKFVLKMDPFYRIAFGVLLIVYAFIRFFRIFNANDEYND